MLEAVGQMEQTTGKKLNWKYVDENRKSDCVCYISNLVKFRSHHRNWSVTITLDENLRQIVQDQFHRLPSVEAR